jgi:hypothetical protein
VLNCQLPEIFWLCAGGAEVGPEGGLEGGPEVLTPPPHPESSTRTESSHEEFDERFVTDFIVRPPVYSELVVSSVALQNGRLYERSVVIVHAT